MSADISDDELEGPDVSDEDLLEAWKEAIADALRRRDDEPDYDGIVVMLRWHAKHGRPVPADALEFLAWFVKEKVKHRPLPAKFRPLKAIARNVNLEMADWEFREKRNEWKAKNPGRRFPFEANLQAVADEHGITTDALRDAVKRAKK